MRRLVLAFALLTFAASPSPAAIGDFRTGSFDGYWCRYQARFDIQSQDANSWVFHGRILIHATGEYDELWIEQYGDNSLRVIRYLAGANAGLTQVVQTDSPYQINEANVVLSIYEARSGNGIGCGTGISWIRVIE